MLKKELERKQALLENEVMKSEKLKEEIARRKLLEADKKQENIEKVEIEESSLEPETKEGEVDQSSLEPETKGIEVEESSLKSEAKHVEVEWSSEPGAHRRKRRGGRGSRMRRLLVHQLLLTEKRGLPLSRLLCLRRTVPGAG